MRKVTVFLCAVLLIISVGIFGLSKTYDVVITSGQIYDGSGGASYVADVGIKDGHIAAIGQLKPDADVVIDAQGLAVAPGFINMLSWANESLLVDGKSQSDIRQGVTLEIMGEGWSMEPSPGRWNTLREYLEYLVKKGVSTNVASFVGATNARVHAVGYQDRPATRKELERMRKFVARAMREGALGVSSALIYAPGFYATTNELIALAEEAGKYDCMYISHIRSEGNGMLKALDEFITTARKANVTAEVYHMKVAGKSNWQKYDDMVKKIEKARAEGLKITANMYTYTAGLTGLNATMPPWVQEGGHAAWVQRLKDPKIRKRLLKEMTTPTNKWENLYLLAGAPENVLLVELRTARLKHLIGKTLAEAARMRGKSPVETAIDLVIEDNSRVEAVYFLMSEENVKRQIKLPWVSFCSDAASLAPEGTFITSNVHPRAYG
ncbi:MAG: N-acyl-D-amino-acid deacylase family protein, partial [Planctomycetota bacterium]